MEPDEIVHRAVNYRFSISSDEAPVRDYLLDAYHSLRVTSERDRSGREDRREQPITRYRYVGNEFLGQLHIDGQPAANRTGIRVVISQLVTHVNASATASFDGFAIHGGGTADAGGRTIVVVGASGSGKTTFTAALLRLGCSYVTDEVIALSPSLDTIVPYPKPLSFKPGSFEFFPELAPDHRFARLTTDAWLVDPARLTQESAPPSLAPALVCLLESADGHGGPLRISHRTRGRGVADIVTQLFDSSTLRVEGMQRIAEFVGQMHPVHVSGGSPTERAEWALQELQDRCR